MTPEALEQLKTYVAEQLQAGANEAELREAIKKEGGWSDEDLKQVFPNQGGLINVPRATIAQNEQITQSVSVPTASNEAQVGKKKMRWWKKLLIVVGILLVAWLGFGYWYSTTPEYQVYLVNKQITDGVEKGTGCDIPMGGGETQHLTQEECVQYRAMQEMIFEGKKQAEQAVKDADSWAENKKSGKTTLETTNVPSDWKEANLDTYGIALRFPATGYMAYPGAGTYYQVFWGGKISSAGPMWGPENEFTINCSSDSQITNKDDDVIEWVTTDITIGGLPGTLRYGAIAGSHVYQASVKKDDVGVWYNFSLGGVESDDLFYGVLKSVSFSTPSDLVKMKGLCSERLY